MGLFKRHLIIVTVFVLLATCLCTNTAFAKEEESTTATVSAVGDLMFMIAQNNAAYARYGSYNYDYMYAPVAPIISSADIAMGNLEAPVAPSVKVAVDGARFNAPEGAIPSLKRAGFDYVSTANNHAADAGRAGLLQTLSLLDKHGMKHSGTQSTAGGKRYVMMSARGINFAVLSYTFLFSRSSAIGADASRLINFINEANIKADIDAAKNEGADVVLVNMHWDREYTAATSSSTKALADRILYYGADAIIGHHPHTLQPMVRKTTTDRYGASKPRFIAYSLGNFISNIDRANSDMTCILQMSFTKTSSGTRLSDASYVPVYFYRTAGHRILPIDRTLNNAAAMASLPAGARSRLQVANAYIKSVLGQNAARAVSGQAITGKWEKSGDKWYYKLSTGSYQKGWLSDGGRWYYLGAGSAMCTGWQSIGGKWYHFAESGAMNTGWVKTGGEWYLLGSDGAMLRGWQKQGASWYYMGSTGAMQTGWLHSAGSWYYLTGSGAMMRGWLLLDGWYHFDYSGAMSTGWKKLGGKWYYFAANGLMAHDTTVDGYLVNSDGVWVQ